MADQNQQRQVAVKARIAEILEGQYIKEEGWTPNYVLTRDGRKISRVNLLGTVISVPTTDVNYRSLTLDDGSRTVSIRSFDDSDVFQGISLGDVVFVVGRPRQYGSEIYIMPEIIKKVQNKAWIEVRRLELERELKDAPLQKEEAVISEENFEHQEKQAEPAAQQTPENQKQKIYNLIKTLDNGEGAEFEQILEKSESENTEKIISQLLMEGEIFELGKGKLKVLE